MTGGMERLEEYLSHISQAISRIQTYVADLSEDEFMSTELIQDAVIRNIEVIGEAARNIQRHYPDFVSEHPELPLSFAYEMRNALAHGYYKVDLGIVWQTVLQDLPELDELVSGILADIAPSSAPQ